MNKVLTEITRIENEIRAEISALDLIDGEPRFTIWQDYQKEGDRKVKGDIFGISIKELHLEIQKKISTGTVDKIQLQYHVADQAAYLLRELSKVRANLEESFTEEAILLLMQVLPQLPGLKDAVINAKDRIQHGKDKIGKLKDKKNTPIKVKQLLKEIRSKRPKMEWIKIQDEAYKTLYKDQKPKITWIYFQRKYPESSIL